MNKHSRTNRLLSGAAAATVVFFTMQTPAHALPTWVWPALIKHGQESEAHFAQLEAAAENQRSLIDKQGGEIAEMRATVNRVETLLGAQQGVVEKLQSTVDAQTTYIERLEAYLEVDETTDPSRPVLRVVAANFQVVDGSGSTINSRNGVGNVIIGYNETHKLPKPASCSDGRYSDPGSCENAAETWGFDYKMGSHNLIVGEGHSYSSWSGVVTGVSNTVNRPGASVLTGTANVASGGYAVVSGGRSNAASGDFSSVSGGEGNSATGSASSVSGGNKRLAKGTYDWHAGSLFQDD